MYRPAAFAIVLSMTATTALADLSLRFIEGAPKDRFVLTSEAGLCADGPILVTIDLNGSAGGLVFDVTAQGAGVEVFQPFELVSGGDLVAEPPVVADGDRAVTLGLSSFAAGAEVAFTIDVDDTIQSREITVTDSEISGAVLRVEAAGVTAEQIIGDNAAATVAWDGCPS
ncbi:aggregation factor core [bacterium]|nr:aggregation factor core [bacterium]